MYDCQIHGPQRVKMPKGDKEFKQFLAFKDVSRQLRVPIVIYADFQSIISKVKTNNMVKRPLKLENSGYAYKNVSTNNYRHFPVVRCHGIDAADHLVTAMLEEQK